MLVLGWALLRAPIGKPPGGPWLVDAPLGQWRVVSRHSTEPGCEAASRQLRATMTGNLDVAHDIAAQSVKCVADEAVTAPSPSN